MRDYRGCKRVVVWPLPLGRRAEMSDVEDRLATFVGLILVLALLLLV